MTSKIVAPMHSDGPGKPELKSEPSKPLGSRPHGTEAAVQSAVIEVALELIEPDRENVRKSFPSVELEELANTLKRDGILQPLLVRPNPTTPGKFILIAGERRLRAAGIAGLKTVSVIVHQVEKVRGIQLIENVHRADLSTLEKADGIAAVMKEEGLDEKAVAVRLGFTSDREVRRHLQLHRAPEFLRDALRDGVRVGVEREGATKTVTRTLEYRTALEVLRIYNHYSKMDLTADKQVAVAKTKTVLERSVALEWTRDDFEEFAASLGKPRRAARRMPGRALYKETPRTFMVDLKRVVESRLSAPDVLDQLIVRLESLLGSLRESRSVREPVPEANR